MRTPLIAALIRVAEGQYRRRNGRKLDLERAWWTPPLSPDEVWRQEISQIEQLELSGLVAITDHDNIQGPLELRAAGAVVPLALEWSVPFGPALFHLGIYNLPAGRALDFFQAMQDCRRRPGLDRLTELLSEIAAIPGALVVFNHPFWDETGIGDARHEEAVRVFLRMFSPYIHAVELNGLRPVRENDRVRSLAASMRKTLISGGDRHGLEPNAVVNTTNAQSFLEFADEIRHGWSNLVFLNRYRYPHGLRMARNTIDMVRNYNRHARGWRVWTDRAFYRDDTGAVWPLTGILARSGHARGIRAEARVAG
jgi:hypothetical protein